jgi:hypothetical protein
MKFLFAFIVFVFSKSIVGGQDLWPGEDWVDATNLTSLCKEFRYDLSGAHWNPVQQELWLVMNGTATIAKISRNQDSSFILQQVWNVSGDIEGITQASYQDSTILIIEESRGHIVEYDISSEINKNPVHTWNISADLPVYNGSEGPEGITFVPDEWLVRKNFVNEKGILETSKNGMGGFIFISHQKEGFIYVFDLNRLDNSYSFIGKYATHRKESAGLEFDRSTGSLLILHNMGPNYLEIADLSSSVVLNHRKLDMIMEFVAPTTGNLEGIAITPLMQNKNYCWLTVDDGLSDAIRWFQHFNPCQNQDCYSTSANNNNSNPDKNQIKIFPNPTHEFFILEHYNIPIKSTVSIFNSSGERVSVDTIHSETVHLNIEGNPGLYILLIQSPSMHNSIHKIIKL